MNHYTDSILQSQVCERITLGHIVNIARLSLVTALSIAAALVTVVSLHYCQVRIAVAEFYSVEAVEEVVQTKIMQDYDAGV